MRIGLSASGAELELLRRWAAMSYPGARLATAIKCEALTAASRAVTGRDGTSQNVTGRDGTSQDVTARDGTSPPVTVRDASPPLPPLSPPPSPRSPLSPPSSEESINTPPRRRRGPAALDVQEPLVTDEPTRRIIDLWSTTPPFDRLKDPGRMLSDLRLARSELEDELVPFSKRLALWWETHPERQSMRSSTVARWISAQWSEHRPLCPPPPQTPPSPTPALRASAIDRLSEEQAAARRMGDAGWAGGAPPVRGTGGGTASREGEAGRGKDPSGPPPLGLPGGAHG